MARMLYQELADALGITLESARRTARKKRWVKTLGNDGLARVEVPDEVLEGRHPDRPKDAPKVNPKETHEDARDARLEDARALISRLESEVSGLKSEVSGVRELIVSEKARADSEARRAEEVTRRLLDSVAERDRWHDLATRPWWRRLTG